MKNVNSYIELCNGGLTLKGIQAKVEQRVRTVAAGLDPRAQYTLGQLYGKKKWAKLSTAERCLAENCMLDFARLHNVMDVAYTNLDKAALYKLSSAKSMQFQHSK
jgi:hypothetical protein